jgi:hypothetical protein
MRPTNKQILYWLPRMLALFGILFLSLFALDVFVDYSSIGEVALALTMHLIPSFVILAATIVAWRWRIVGGVLFIMLGFFSIAYFHTYQNLISFMLLSVPPMIVGMLFLWEGMMSWVYRDIEAMSKS